MIRERTLLQACISIAAGVPVAAGIAGVAQGVGMVPGAVRSVPLDSHFTYLSGLLLAIGLGFWSVVPRIEEHAGRMRLLTALVVVGGVARTLAMLRDGPPGVVMELALAMELAVTPLLCLWQGRVAAQDRARPLPPRPAPAR